MRRFFLRLITFVRSGRADAELARELEAHLQLLEDQFVAQGQRREDARIAARRAFDGQLEQVKLRQRDVRSFRWLDESWLDLKLGARMLARYPGLTVIGARLSGTSHRGASQGDRGDLFILLPELLELPVRVLDSTEAWDESQRHRAWPSICRCGNSSDDRH